MFEARVCLSLVVLSCWQPPIGSRRQWLQGVYGSELFDGLTVALTVQNTLVCSVANTICALSSTSHACKAGRAHLLLEKVIHASRIRSETCTTSS